MIDERNSNATIVLKGEARGDSARIMKNHPVTRLRKIKGNSDFHHKEIALSCNHYNASPAYIFLQTNLRKRRFVFFR